MITFNTIPIIGMAIRSLSFSTKYVIRFLILERRKKERGRKERDGEKAREIMSKLPVNLIHPLSYDKSTHRCTYCINTIRLSL